MFRRRGRAAADTADGRDDRADGGDARADGGDARAGSGRPTLPVDEAFWTAGSVHAAPSGQTDGGTESTATSASPFGPVSDPFGATGAVSHAAAGSADGGRTATALLELPPPVEAPAVDTTLEAPDTVAVETEAPPDTPADTAPLPDADADAPLEPETAGTAAQAEEPETVPAPSPAEPAEPAGQPEPASDNLPVHVDRRQLSPELLRLKVMAQDALVERMGARLYDRTLLDDQIEDLVGSELSSFLVERDVELDDDDLLLFTEEVINDLLRHGPIEPYLRDDGVSEVMVNGLESIYVERNGRLQETSSRFLTEAHLRQVIERIVSKVGRRIDESSPMVDARLPDGSRVNAVIPPLAVDGPSLTIRKFAKDALGVDDLVRFGTLDRQSVEFLAACVRGRLNVLVSGGTGTGKTTLLNTLSSFIPDDERIVTIEDAVELQLHQRHIVRLESRPANVEGRGQVTIRDLVRNSLRMRPDRVIIGECRGGEALDMLQAMNTGHDGSLSTLHANGPRDALSRLETLCLMAGMELPMRAIREQIASAVHLIVHVARLRDGSRKVTHITEVVGLEGEVITLSDIFTFDFDAGFDEEGHYLGTLQPTGLVPGVVRKLEEHGVHVSNDLFDTGEDW